MLPFIIFFTATPPPHLYTFPTRRSSDLRHLAQRYREDGRGGQFPRVGCPAVRGPPGDHLDRKSTRLNSSHVNISYAVFCLKKKKTSIFTFNQLILYITRKAE